MRCPSCGFDNPEGMNFCGKCANPLSPRCPQCGFENPAGFAFCGKCATPLTPQPHPPVSSFKFQVSSFQLPTPSPQPPVSYTPKHLAERILAEQAALEARGAPEGERKTITALFADVAGFTALARDLDPEDTRAIIDPALQLMMDAVHRYEGYVAQSLGDGIFALFGAPIAHEDHGQCALYAALRMQEEMRQYASRIRLEKGVPLQMRVGLNTGEVVLRSIRKDDLHTDYVPVGHSVNLASRMESLAMPGSIVASENTYKLVEGYSDCKALGAVQVKGLDEPLSIYEVLGIGPLRTRLQVAARRGLVRFVGRQSELEQLKKSLEQAKAGHGQIVGVMGEPGVGKSRLFYEFVGATHASPLRLQYGCLVLETFSVSHGKAYPYLPLIDLLTNYFQFAPQDDERRRQEKITGKVLTLDRSLEDTLSYFFSLLGIAEPTSSLAQMDPQIRKRRTFEAIRRLLVRESLKQPLILIFEDLHWLDSETQAFLTLLSESLATARILLLVNYRPEYRHEWGSKTYYTQLRLDPLGQAEAQDFLTALLGNDATVQPLKQLILAKTEGNPFFMEEIVQALVEQGVLPDLRRVGTAHLPLTLMKPLADIKIPSTVQGVLSSRIDRLPPEEKELLQTLAVIGKEFPFSLLTQVVDKPEDKLHGLLSHLQAAEFIYEQPAFPEVEYTFKHALTQEVAYNSVLQGRRRSLHERTAQAIEALYHTRLEDHYGDLAHHYSRSGNTEKAVEYLGLAGQQAVQRSANAEAISHLTIALELLKTLPDTPKRTQQELSLLAALGLPVQITQGYGIPEAEKIYTRARELCQQVGENPHLSSVLWGVWVFYLARADLQTARDLGQQLFTLAQKMQNRALFVEAHFTLADTLFHLGDFTAALEHAKQGITYYDPQQHRALAFTRGFDSGVICQCYGAWSLWTLGYVDQARKKVQDALNLAQDISHPLTLGTALAFAAYVYRYCNEPQIARERAEAGVTLCTEYGFPYWSAHGILTRGWDLVRQGQIQEGIAQIHQSLALLQTTGVDLDRPYFLALLAETYEGMNQPEEGLGVVAEALAELHGDGERFEAELYRLKGELTLQKFQVSSSKLQVENSLGSSVQGRESEAEECFLRAIEIAQRQQAKSLELRAVMSLSRLWRQQDKKKEAHQMFSEIYNWFTEGFDTKDLQEAKALLESLESRV